MASGYNKVMLMGNLTRDVEMRFTPSNTPVGTFGLAVNRTWRTPEGEKKEEVSFIDCEVWGKQAEIMKQYLGKGRSVFIEGRLKQDTWKDKTDGSNRSKVKVVVEEFRFTDSKPGGAGAPGGGGGAANSAGNGGGGGGGGGPEDFDQSTPSPQVRTNRAGAGAGSAPAPQPMGEDDIPF
ncbi:MAG: single-stranded DNA-binding protein [Phycisphaerales bacterium]